MVVALQFIFSASGLIASGANIKSSNYEFLDTSVVYRRLVHGTLIFRKSDDGTKSLETDPNSDESHRCPFPTC